MNHVFATIMLANGTIAAYLALQRVFILEQKYIVNRILTIFTIGSAIWSFGFGALFLQTDTNIAYYCRSIGMIGVFVYLISAQLLIGHISEIPKALRSVFGAISFLGVGVYFLTILRDQTVFYLSEHGMTYHFEAGVANTIYTVYTLVVAADMFAVSIHMVRRAKTHRLREFGKYFLIVEILIFLGMILDTIFPLVGLSAIPGSSITQFWGLCVLQYAVVRINHSRITIPNMSEFVYYSLSSPVLVYDTQHNIQLINDAADSFFPEKRQEILQKNLSVQDLFEMETKDIFSFDGTQCTYDAKCRGTQLFCSFTVNKIQDHYGDLIGYIIIVSDQTERVRAMRAMEEARLASEQANCAKSTFLANMSHEIRTPMNAIMGFSELLLQEPLSTKAREYSGDIHASAGNLLAIVNDILDITKIESGKMELQCTEYDTASMLRNVCEIIEPLARKKQLVFETDFGDDIPRKMYGDEIRIRGILVNLLNNAVKYTKNGTVTLRMQVLAQHRDSVVLRFEIEDTGIGIRDEDKTHLFEKFSQVDRKINSGIEGTGLGLAIVKGYLEMMGGSVRVESVYGEGSCFSVELRQQVVDAGSMNISIPTSADTKPQDSMGRLWIRNTDVLVVDDNAINLKVICNILSNYGIEATAVSSGAEAIACCKKHHYALILMDQMMPQMDGIEAMRHIRLLDSYYAEGGAVKIIALTANAIHGAREELLAAGFDEYLSKPIEFARLEDALRRFVLPQNQSVTIEDIQNPKESLQKKSERKQEELQANSAEVMDSLETREEYLAIDLQAGIGHCGGNEQVYREVLVMIVEAGMKQAQECQQFVAEENYKDYVIGIHTLKSQLYNIGAEILGDEAKLLEAAGRERNADYIRNQLPAFSTHYSRLLAVLAEGLEHAGIYCSPKRESLAETLEKIQQLAVEMDVAGIGQKLIESEHIFAAAGENTLFTKLQNLADDVDLEGIVKLLQNDLVNG